MHDPIRNTKLLFYVLGFFSAAVSALLLFFIAASDILDGLALNGLVVLVSTALFSGLNFVIGWGFLKKKVWAWYAGLAEMFIISLWALYQLLSFDLGGLTLLVLSGAAAAWLWSIKSALRELHA
ncbi:hypothetical protein [Microbulbifer mangrovi]|uniref:hypothetical protein n=1 Tax=Microbulbifer mangrovi TaxID=927787 RepID=UPI00099056CC|nr:hypothetical protein [Microbulbifer mangrovi]